MTFLRIYLPANICNLFFNLTQVHSDNTLFLDTGSLNIKYSMTHQLKHSISLDLMQEFGTVFLKSIRVLPKHKFFTTASFETAIFNSLPNISNIS